MIYLLAIVSLAAICNAVMDILENENFHNSRLGKLNEKWWYKRESWKYAKKVFGWKFDGWHVFKSIMIMLLLSGIAHNILEWLILGIVWNASFNIAYKFLKK